MEDILKIRKTATGNTEFKTIEIYHPYISR
jgi:hypothetical protein